MYRFNSYTKNIKQLRDYIEMHKLKFEATDIKKLINTFNYGLPLPSFDIELQTSSIVKKESNQLAYFINQLTSPDSTFFVDLYIGEIQESTNPHDDLYVIPSHYMFDPIKLLKYQRTLSNDCQKKMEGSIDNLYAKFNHYTIFVNEVYKKGH